MAVPDVVRGTKYFFKWGFLLKNSSEIQLLVQPVSPKTILFIPFTSIKNSAFHFGFGSAAGSLLFSSPTSACPSAESVSSFFLLTLRLLPSPSLSRTLCMLRNRWRHLHPYSRQCHCGCIFPACHVSSCPSCPDHFCRLHVCYDLACRGRVCHDRVFHFVSHGSPVGPFLCLD